MTEAQTLAALKDAYELIRDPQNWTTGQLARDANQEPCNPWDSFAASWCASGALYRSLVKDDDHEEIEEANVQVMNETGPWAALMRALGHTIVPVNDGQDGHARICEGFRKAIADLTPREIRDPKKVEVEA